MIPYILPRFLAGNFDLDLSVPLSSNGLKSESVTRCAPTGTTARFKGEKNETYKGLVNAPLFKRLRVN